MKRLYLLELVILIVFLPIIANQQDGSSGDPVIKEKLEKLTEWLEEQELAPGACATRGNLVFFAVGDGKFRVGFCHSRAGDIDQQPQNNSEK